MSDVISFDDASRWLAAGWSLVTKAIGDLLINGSPDCCQGAEGRFIYFQASFQTLWGPGCQQLGEETPQTTSSPVQLWHLISSVTRHLWMLLLCLSCDKVFRFISFYLHHCPKQLSCLLKRQFFLHIKKKEIINNMTLTQVCLQTQTQGFTVHIRERNKQTTRGLWRLQNKCLKKIKTWSHQVSSQNRPSNQTKPFLEREVTGEGPRSRWPSSYVQTGKCCRRSAVRTALL